MQAPEFCLSRNDFVLCATQSSNGHRAESSILLSVSRSSFPSTDCEIFILLPIIGIVSLSLSQLISTKIETFHANHVLVFILTMTREIDRDREGASFFPETFVLILRGRETNERRVVMVEFDISF